MTKKALIVFASLTGNTEKISQFLANCLSAIGVETRLIECQQINPSEFLSYDICVVGSYTYGSSGNLPDEIYPFYEDLGKLNLSGKVFGTFGSGEKDYGYFCKAADDFALQFKKTGALQVAEPLHIEEAPNIEDKKRIAVLAESLFKSSLIAF